MSEQSTDDTERYWCCTKCDYKIHWHNRKFTNRVIDHLRDEHGIGEVRYIDTGEAQDSGGES